MKRVVGDDFNSYSILLFIPRTEDIKINILLLYQIVDNLLIFGNIGYSEIDIGKTFE